MRIILLVLFLLQGCVGHDYTLRENPTTTDRLKLAGMTMECEARSHQDAVAWGTMGAVMSGAGAGMLSLGMGQNDTDLTNLGLATLGFSSVFTTVSLIRQIETADYQSKAGQLLTGVGTVGCELEPPGQPLMEQKMQSQWMGSRDLTPSRSLLQ